MISRAVSRGRVTLGGEDEGVCQVLLRDVPARGLVLDHEWVVRLVHLLGVVFHVLLLVHLDEELLKLFFLGEIARRSEPNYTERTGQNLSKELTGNAKYALEICRAEATIKVLGRTLTSFLRAVRRWMRVLAANFASHLRFFEAESEPREEASSFARSTVGRCCLPVWAFPASVAFFTTVFAPLVLQRVYDREALHEHVSLLLVSGLDVQNGFDEVDSAL